MKQAQMVAIASLASLVVVAGHITGIWTWMASWLLMATRWVLLDPFDQDINKLYWLGTYAVLVAVVAKQANWNRYDLKTLDTQLCLTVIWTVCITSIWLVWRVVVYYVESWPHQCVLVGALSVSGGLAAICATEYILTSPEEYAERRRQEAEREQYRREQYHRAQSLAAEASSRKLQSQIIYERLGYDKNGYEKKQR